MLTTAKTEQILEAHRRVTAYEDTEDPAQLEGYTVAKSVARCPPPPLPWSASDHESGPATGKRPTCTGPSRLRPCATLRPLNRSLPGPSDARSERVRAIVASLAPTFAPGDYEQLAEARRRAAWRTANGQDRPLLP